MTDAAAAVDDDAHSPRRTGCDHGPEIRISPNVQGLQASSTVAINARSDDLRERGHRIFKMGLGQSPFPVPHPVIEALQQNAFQKDYLPVRGLRELREAVAAHHCRSFGITTHADHVLIGPGSKELMFLLQLVSDGEIVIPTPTWVSYAPQARIIGRRVQWLPTSAEGGWRVSPNQLETLCQADPTRPRILVLNYPSNPTGTTYTANELSGLADVARRYRLVVLSDEIYAKLRFDGKHVSIVPFYPEGTIFSGGLSKWCGAGGWRLGLFVFPECLARLRDTIAAVASETFTSTSAPIQHAAVRAFADDPEIERYLQHVRRLLQALAQRLGQRLAQANIEVCAPSGGFYLFPNFASKAAKLQARGISTSAELCERLLSETGVATLPGSNFGRPPSEFSARIAFVNFDGGRALEQIRAMPPGTVLTEDFLRTYCADVLEGVERICEWVDR